MGNLQPAAEAPIALAGHVGVLNTYLAEQIIPALMKKGALESLGGQLDFAQDNLHLRMIGAIANLRANPAGHYVTGVADFAKEMPRRPPQAQTACMMSPCTVSTLGQLILPGGGLQRFF